MALSSIDYILMGDKLRHIVKKAGESINLTPNEFKILSILAQNSHKVFTRSHLVSLAFGYDFEGFDRTISINFFFSGYIRDSRGRDDLKVVQYVESLYADYEEINSNSEMNLMHYAFSEDVAIQIRDMNNNISFNSSIFGTNTGIADEYSKNEQKFSFRSYPFIVNDEQVGTVDIGRPKSILANIEDEKFIITINSIFVVLLLLLFKAILRLLWTEYGNLIMNVFLLFMVR